LDTARNLSIFSSLCTAPHHLEEINVLDGYFLPNEVDLHQVMVLPKAEWERIQDNLDSTTREAARILAEKKEREEMHLRSKAAVKDWPNTIMGLAQRKLKAKKLREEREEEERKLLDLEEQRFQAAKRKEALDHAKTYLYYQNERVKGLHSALLLAEVLKERDAQVEFKKLKSDVNKKKGEEKEHEHKEAILREEEKAHQCYMNQQALRRDQLEQRSRSWVGGLACVARGRKTRSRIAEFGSSNASGRPRCVPGMLWELMFFCRLTQEHQDKIVYQLAVQMNEALKREDDRLAKDIAKKEAEQEKKRKEKEAKEKAAIESIAEHRATVVRNLASLLFPFLHQAEKQAKKQQEKQADLDYVIQREAIALFKEREFQSYAKQVIESESKTTHHLYPLLKASKDGRGLGHGPFSRGREGINSSFQAQDGAGGQLPCCSCTPAQEVKNMK
uniref:CC173 protein n=1 Tax=Buteo japonicus TaxID=224669 RepID=A0A8C0BEL4_9AVES